MPHEVCLPAALGVHQIGTAIDDRSVGFAQQVAKRGGAD
jgi:hypothetical protein